MYGSRSPGFVGRRIGLTRYRNKIHARIPEPNENVTMTMGSKTVVDRFLPIPAWTYLSTD